MSTSSSSVVVTSACHCTRLPGLRDPQNIINFKPGQLNSHVPTQNFLNSHLIPALICQRPSRVPLCHLLTIMRPCLALVTPSISQSAKGGEERMRGTAVGGMGQCLSSCVSGRLSARGSLPDTRGTRFLVRPHFAAFTSDSDSGALRNTVDAAAAHRTQVQ